MEKTDARILARAALEAIAQSSDEMIDAGIAKYVQINTGTGISRSDLRQMWRAMHAAMMKDGT